MTSHPKPRRKKQLEPLDWRELAEGPALRGLMEVLSTSPEVARERASKRAEVEAQPTSREGRTSPSADFGAVGVSPSVGAAFLEQPIALRQERGVTLAFEDNIPAL